MLKNGFFDIDRLRTVRCEEFPKVKPERLWQEDAILIEREIPVRQEQWIDNWEQRAPILFQDFVRTIHSRWSEVARIEGLEREMLLLKQRLNQLERSSPIYVPIETFAPEPYEVLKPFHAVVQTRDDEYIATFFDANLNASGSTEEEAIFNLKDVIAGIFECLLEHDEKNLGPEPARQLRVLKTFLKKTN